MDALLDELGDNDMSTSVESKEYDGMAKYYDLMLEPLLHGIRKKLAAWIKQHKVERVLDIGCGTGKQISMVSSETQIVGIDISHSMLRQAEKKVPGRCMHGNATALSFPDDHFDMVYTQFALHEKDEAIIDGLLREAHRVLKKNGYLVIVDYTAPPHRGPFSKMSHKGITFVEKMAGEEHYANYRKWIARGGIDAVLREYGWIEQSTLCFYGCTIKMGIYQLPQGGEDRVH